MNILHLLSQTHLTGAEKYATALIGEQQKKHRCFIISDTLNSQTHAFYQKRAIDNRRLFNRLKQLWLLYRFCRLYQIDVIHSHSRAASWLAHYVGRILPLKHIATVHGRQGGNAPSKRANVYGKHIIAICPEIKTHLMRDLNISGSDICVIYNGFDLLPLQSAKKPIKKIAWIGRLTGPKGELIKRLTTEVFAHFPQLSFDCIGGPNEQLANFTENTPSHCRFLGQVDDVIKRLGDYDLVFGSGRVAIEAMFLAKPVFAIGEATSIGILNADNINAGQDSNFGDCGVITQLNTKKIIKALTLYLDKPHYFDYGNVLKDYQINAVHEQVMRLYNA